MTGWVPGGVYAAQHEPAATVLPASKTQINKAGDVLRKAATEHRRPSLEYREALGLVRAYRAAHSYPLAHVTAGMRHHAKKAAGGSWLDIGQRLKQMPTITDKLVRMPKTNLARMQDIGGCRATFLDQETVDAAIASIESRAKPGMAWDIVDIDDYVTERTRAGWLPSQACDRPQARPADRDAVPHFRPAQLGRAR